MNFKEGHIYHIFNQGNNRQKIFFEERNYNFFKQKIREHILPYGDILAWCLMPNHFHLMVYVKESPGATPSRTRTHITLNKSIGILLASYTRAINLQEKRSGSLFRKETKAICLTNNERITPSWFDSPGGAIMNISDPSKQYPKICFDYIHNNPVKDGFTAEDWEYSSAKEYLKKGSNKLVNAEMAFELGLVE